MVYKYLEPTVRKTVIEDEIRTINSKIRKVEKLYESLRNFKSDATKSQEDFSEVNKRKKVILEPLDTVCEVNKAARRYNSGMKKSLSSVGMKVVDVSFSGLINMIDIKLKNYREQLEANERRLSTLNDALAETEREIRDIEAAGGK